MDARTTGWTLFELIAVLGITSILAMAAFPSATRMLERSATTAAANRLVGSINFARHSAIVYNELVTVCALKADNRCGGNWAKELSVFADKDHDAEFDAEDRLIRRIRPDGGASVTWRSFGRKPYLQLTPYGYTNYMNGNFTICGQSADTWHARQLVINVQGRVRLNHRRDDAGRPIDRRGKPLRC